MTQLEATELQRQNIQIELDSGKTKLERNKLGQFATPPILARDIVDCSKSFLSRKTKIAFIDPAFGTGSFYSALLNAFSKPNIEKAVGYEIDEHYGKRAILLWKNTPLRLFLKDFTRVEPPLAEEGQFDLLICNPPYVRHHHVDIDAKDRMRSLILKNIGIDLSGLSGFYCYYLCLCHGWMRQNSVAGWLIPSEFMDVNYGKELKKYLSEQVSLLRIHRFDPNMLQFGDALVSSAVVWFKKTKPSANQSVEFTYGDLKKPSIIKKVPLSELKTDAKWSRFIYNSEDRFTQSKYRISDFFKIKRGVATGCNDFFVLNAEKAAHYKLPKKFLQPILPSPRYLEATLIQSDIKGDPIIEGKSYLLKCDLPESHIREKYPKVWDYILEGVKQRVNEGYLCRSRSPWYSQEDRSPSMFLCTYMGRQSEGKKIPFRFILNHSKAIAANVYLMLYPKDNLKSAIDANPKLGVAIWETLKNCSKDFLLREGRVYGGGLYKLEPAELGRVSADSIACLLPASSLIPQEARLL